MQLEEAMKKPEQSMQKGTSGGSSGGSSSGGTREALPPQKKGKGK
jgi:hypothetical protein